MRLKNLLLLFLICLNYKRIEADSFWSFNWLTNAFGKIFSKSTEDNSSTMIANYTQNNPDNENTNPDQENAGSDVKRDIKDDETNFWEHSQIPPHCEEAILLPLARLKIVSPEKIIELITANDLAQTCYRVSSTVGEVKKAIEKCNGFPPDHLYKKLTDGLEEFDQIVCKEVEKDSKATGSSKKILAKKHLTHYKECLNQLQDELYDCEGPADWFEKRNQSIACQFYNDIIDCNYVKAAMLCGKSAARLIRDFSDAIMRQVLTYHCKKSRAIPHVDSPMADSSSGLHFSSLVLLLSLGHIHF